MKTETKEMEGEFEGHTPGAWYIGFNLTSVYSCDNPKYIANVNGRNSYEAKQNAKLIAAAPDLLKENQSLRSELSKAKELNGELVKIKNLVEELIEVAHFRNQWPTTTEAFESLIKKSEI